MSDIIRIVRVLEYVGPRDALEKALAQNAVKGIQQFGDITIREAILAPGFPEALPAPTKPAVTFADLELSVRALRVFGPDMPADQIPALLAAPKNAYPGMTLKIRKELNEIWENIKDRI